MATTPLVVPPGFSAEGTTRVWWDPTATNVVASPSVATNLKATTTLDISCYLTNGLNLDASTDKIADDRLCLKVVVEGIGTVKFSLGDLEYIWDPQHADSLSNKAYTALTPGSLGSLWIRFGMDAEVDPAASQKVWQVLVELGPQVPLNPERNTKGRVKQSIAVRGVENDVTLAA